MLLLLLGTVCIFSGSGKVLFGSISQRLHRLGAERPQALMRSDKGGWDRHDALGYEKCFFLGEIDLKYPI